MKRKTLTAFLLMTSLLAGTACAQMNYDLINPNLRYEKLDADEAMPMLIDVLDEATDPDEASAAIISYPRCARILVSVPVPQQRSSSIRKSPGCC